MDDDQFENAFFGRRETPQELASFGSFVSELASTASSAVTQNFDSFLNLLNDGMKGLTITEQISEQRKSNKREAENAIEKLSEDRQKRPTYLDWLNAPTLWLGFPQTRRHGQDDEEDQAAKENRFLQLHWWIQEAEASSSSASPDQSIPEIKQDGKLFEQNVFTLQTPPEPTANRIPIQEERDDKVEVQPAPPTTPKNDFKKKPTPTPADVIELIDSDDEDQTVHVEKETSAGKVRESSKSQVIGEIASIKKDSSARVEAIRKRAEAMKLEHQSYIKELKEEDKLRDGRKRGGEGAYRYLIPTTPISEEELATLRKAFGSGHRDDEVCERFDAKITKHCFRTADPGRWLNDEIVNAYMQMCERRGKDQPDRPYVFSSFFLTTLVREKIGYSYPDVQRWTARGKGKADLFARRAVIFPVNIGNTHWVMVCADVKFKRITYYDSMGGEGRSVLETIFRYLKDEHQSKKNAPLPDGWEFVSPKKTVPQQNNCNDCGVFTCMFGNTLMEYFLREQDATPPPTIFCFSVNDMDRIRQQIQLDILRENVFPN
jgi:hypothetical protein